MIKAYFRCTSTYYTQRRYILFVSYILFAMMLYDYSIILAPQLEKGYPSLSTFEKYFWAVSALVVFLVAKRFLLVGRHAPTSPIYIEATCYKNESLQSKCISEYPFSLMNWSVNGVLSVMGFVLSSQASWYMSETTSYALLMVSFVTLGDVFVYVAFASADWYALRIVQRIYPEYSFTNMLIAIIATLHLHAYFRRELELRLRCMLLLRLLASLTENHFARRIAMAGGKDQAIEERFLGVANSIRSKVFWLAFPKADTVFFFDNFIVGCLACIVNGTWDEFQIEDREVPRVSQWIWALTAARTFLMLALPFLALWGLQQTRFALDEPQREAALLAAIVWAFVSIFARMDPNFRGNITTLGEVAGVVRGDPR